MENKTDEEDDVEFEFPFSIAWYTWVILIIAGILYAIFVFPFLWVKDKISGFCTTCKYAVAIHNHNQL